MHMWLLCAQGVHPLPRQRTLLVPGGPWEGHLGMRPLPQHKPVLEALGLGTTQGKLRWGRSLRASPVISPHQACLPGQSWLLCTEQPGGGGRACSNKA